MLNEKQLHDQLGNAALQHRKLAAKFAEMAKHVEAQVSAPHYPVPDIVTALQLEQGVFSTTFAGRTLSFVFSSSLGTEGSLIGQVACYMKKDFPQPVQVALGGFGFSASGQTSRTVLPEHVPADMDTALGASLITLHFIHTSLTQ
jgi:hypothetical protein